MSTEGLVAEEVDKQASLASAALRDFDRAGIDARQMLPRATLAVLAPYSAMLYFAERVIESSSFDADLVEALHSKLLPFERRADELLSDARHGGYFNNPETAQPLRWLEECNEKVKDCMVAIETMLDSSTDDLLAEARVELQRGETIPLSSLR